MPQLDLGKVVGDTGPQGPKGDQGIQGPAGQTGPGVAVGGSANQVLVKHSGTNYDTQWVDAGSLPGLAGAHDAIAIVANGDTHPAIASGQFVYVRNHSTLAEGLYKATAAIGTDVALTTSNLTADSAGGLNDLQAQVSSLNSKFTWKYVDSKTNHDNILVPSGATDIYVKIRHKNGYEYGQFIVATSEETNRYFYVGSVVTVATSFFAEITYRGSERTVKASIVNMGGSTVADGDFTIMVYYR